MLNAGGDFDDGVTAYEGNWLGADTFLSFDGRAVNPLEPAASLHVFSAKQKFATTMRRKPNSMNHLRRKSLAISVHHWLRGRCQIIELVIQMVGETQRTVCPLTKKAISKNHESGQSVTRFADPNFRLKHHEIWLNRHRALRFAVSGESAAACQATSISSLPARVRGSP